MKLQWEQDRDPDTPNDLNLREPNDDGSVGSFLGWLRRAETGEMVWMATPYERRNTTHVLGNISEEEAKARVEAMVLLES